MNAAQLKALAEWWRMLQGRGQFKDTAAIEMEQRLNRMAREGHEAAGQPSGMELTQIRDRREALARRRLQELLPERERERTLQGQLEGAEITTVPGKELAVIPRAEKQARVYEYKNVPNIQVDPSGEAKIISDLSASIKRYREMKTGMEPEVTSFDPVEQARRLEGAEQAIPDRGLPENVPEWALIQQEQMKAERYQASEANKKRVERLRAAQAGKVSKFDKLVERYKRAAGKRIRELKRKGHSRSGRMGGGYLPADLAGNLKDSTMKSMILGHRRKPWN